MVLGVAARNRLELPVTGHEDVGVTDVGHDAFELRAARLPVDRLSVPFDLIGRHLPHTGAGAEPVRG